MRISNPKFLGKLFLFFDELIKIKKGIKFLSENIRKILISNTPFTSLPFYAQIIFRESRLFVFEFKILYIHH